MHQAQHGVRGPALTRRQCLGWDVKLVHRLSCMQQRITKPTQQSKQCHAALFTVQGFGLTVLV